MVCVIGGVMVVKKRRLFAIALIIWLLPTLLVTDMVTPLVKVESKLYSRMVFLDYDYAKKMVDGNVEIAVLYDTGDHFEIAKRFAQDLGQKQMLGKSVAVRLHDVNDFERVGIPTAFITVLETQKLKKIAKALISKKRLVFVYDEANIAYGMVGIRLGANIVPVINIENLIQAGINLRPIVFQVAKVYDGGY